MNYQGNLEHRKKMKSPETKFKVMEDCDLSNRELKISCEETQQYTRNRKADQWAQEQNEYVTKEIKTIKKKTNSGAEKLLNEMRNEVESTENRASRWRKEVGNLKTEMT